MLTSPFDRSAPALALVVAAVVLVCGVLFRPSGSSGEASFERKQPAPSSKTLREWRESSAHALAGGERLALPEESDPSAVATVAARTMVLADGTVIQAGQLLPVGAIAPEDMSGNGSGISSNLRRRLLERAGKLAIHSDDPWRSLVLVAQAYHQMGDLEARQLWFDRAIRLATDPDSSLESSLALRDVIKGMLAVGEVGQGLEVIHRIPLPRFRELAMAEVVRTVAFRRDFRRATELAGRIRDSGARILALRGLAEAQGRFGSIDRALETVRAIPVGKSRDDALMRVALARASLGDQSGVRFSR